MKQKWQFSHKLSKGNGNQTLESKEVSLLIKPMYINKKIRNNFWLETLFYEIGIKTGSRIGTRKRSKKQSCLKTCKHYQMCRDKTNWAREGEKFLIFHADKEKLEIKSFKTRIREFFFFFLNKHFKFCNYYHDLNFSLR